MSINVPLIINPDGITATVSWEDDSYSHDSGYYTYTVYVTFADDALNPPNEKTWLAGSFEKHNTQFTPAMAMEVGQRFYDFLMSFRTLYGETAHVRAWQKRCEDEADARRDAIRQQQRAEDKLRWAQARIAELESDYVKILEAEVKLYRQTLVGVRELLNPVADIATKTLTAIPDHSPVQLP